MLAAATPVPVGPSEEVPWWEDTLMDKDKDGIQDNIWIAIEVFPDEFVDEDDRIGVIVDLITCRLLKMSDCWQMPSTLFTNTHSI